MAHREIALAVALATLAGAGCRSGAASDAAREPPPALVTAPGARVPGGAQLQGGGAGLDPGALNPSESRLPTGMAAIHYHRADGSYVGWGLYSWERGQGGVERALPGVTWDRPMEPSGRDDFGLVWLVPMAEYHDSYVHFVIHRGAEREHCGQDEQFTTTLAREAWVVSGVCDHFTLKREAIEHMLVKH